MLRQGRLFQAFSFLAGVLVWFNAVAQTPPAGTIGLLKGQASALSISGESRALAKGSAVYSGETIQTGPQSYVLINFSDQSTTMLRPSTQFVIEKYQFNGGAAGGAAAPAAPAAPAASGLAPLQTTVEKAPEASFFRLLKGGLRVVSGLIGHADYSHFRLSTPVATMGIRGTDFIVATCEGECQADPEVIKSVPAGSSTNGAVVSGSYNGTITVTSITGQTMTLAPGQFCITLADGSQYLLGAEPAFLSSTGAAAAGGTGGVAGAEAAAESVLIAGSITAGVTAAIFGVVIAGSSSNGTNGTTGTSGTTSTGPAH
ncbi:MAG: hypothetical protein ISP90_05550 [Nevskia sp.]|nr:hypothetical protein [Nevskia sp.]